MTIDDDGDSPLRAWKRRLDEEGARKLQEIRETCDEEGGHKEADDVLLELLSILHFDKTVAEYRKQPRWFA